MKISIIHPSRQRPLISFENISKWVNNSKGEIEIIVSLDNDDPELSRYKDLYDKTGAKLIFNENRSAVDAINKAAEESTGDILIVVSDDTDCFEGWDKAIINFIDGRNDWILKCQDGIQKWIITMPVMDRFYYKRFGYIYFPEYRHMFCDTELTCVADLTDRILTCELMFKHNHYSIGGIPMDTVSQKADATWLQGEKLFIGRAQNDFDLINPVGEIKSESYKTWLIEKINQNHI